MSEFAKLEDANRLGLISQRVGFALWQLQELESIAATYLVLVARAKQGMGLALGEELLIDALSKPFGKTVKDLKKAEKLPYHIVDQADHQQLSGAGEIN